MTSAQLRENGTEIRPVPIASIRKDGETQHRTRIDRAAVAEYADSMCAGVVFPPVRIWSDGQDYWLSDGFQRMAAAEQAHLAEISAEIHSGTLEDARWDSYAANGEHGVRRTVEDTKRIVRLAFQHANAAHMSNVEMAKHLHIPETTLRRWRKARSSSIDEDPVRIVRRGEATYGLPTQNIGRTVHAPHAKSVGQLRAGIEIMKHDASTEVRRLLTVVGNWAFGCATHAECLAALERVLHE